MSDKTHCLFVGATIGRPLLSSDLGSMWASTPTECAAFIANRRVRSKHFLASPAGEVTSAVCAEVGRV